MRTVFTILLLAGLATTLAAQEYIVITRGGGVTGHTTVFRISRSGEVAKGSGAIEPEFSEFSQLRKAKAKKFFRKTHALLKEHSFNYPGNTYAAIALSGPETEGRLVWGDPTHETPDRVRRLYEKIQASLGRLTFHKDLRK